MRNADPGVRSLRRRSVSSRLLGLGVRITPGAWKSVLVSVVCCQVEVSEVSATHLSLVQGSPTDCGVSKYDLEISTMRMSRPTRAVEPVKKRS